MQTVFDEISRIENWAAKAGVSLDDVCEAAKINRSTLTRWKKGKISPRLKKWELFTQVPENYKKSRGRKNA